MKENMRKVITMIISLFCMVITISAQDAKCPLTGYWHNLSIGGNWGEASITLIADKKVGQNPYMSKIASNGYINLTDVNFEKEKIYNLTYSKTISENTYEFIVQYYVGKQLKSGQLQLKRTGTKLSVIGIDPTTKKQPIHGKLFEKSPE